MKAYNRDWYSPNAPPFSLHSRFSPTLDTQIVRTLNLGCSLPERQNHCNGAVPLVNQHEPPCKISQVLHACAYGDCLPLDRKQSPVSERLYHGAGSYLKLQLKFSTGHTTDRGSQTTFPAKAGHDCSAPLYLTEDFLSVEESRVSLDFRLAPEQISNKI